MQRWWYGDDNDKPRVQPRSPNKNKNRPSSDRKWKFQVLVTRDLLSKEKLAITGDCEALGNWSPQDIVLMSQNEHDESIWESVIDLPSDRVVCYRYLIVSVEPTTEITHIRSWETHLEPREVKLVAAENNKVDTYGDVDGVEKIERGWLTSETIVQFKFFNNPFMLKEKQKNKQLLVKVTPINLRATENQVTEDSVSNDTRDNTNDQPAYAFVEVVTLNRHTEFQPQEQFGRLFKPDDYLVISVTVTEPENVAYVIDLYTYSSRASDDEPPYHFGYQYVLPNLLKKSDGKLELPITCASRHRPLGMMRMDFLKITPLDPERSNLKQSFARYWNSSWTGLDVGHRGSGTSFKANDGTVIRENTIASLKKAAAHGADMVEFDVQLSKDLVPVIYHDFFVYVSLKKKTVSGEIQHDMLELPMKELTLAQLKELKVYHVAEGLKKEQKFFDEHLEEHQPFPTLAHALDTLDTSVGFNIEIKWGQELEDGSHESGVTTDRNLYLDCILDVVLSKASDRRIVFSCFDPDICYMLRQKQSLYPVMFLTCGITKKWIKYRDPRCSTIEYAVRHALCNELLGIVAHTEDILRDNSQIKLAKDQGLIVFCWGDDNNCKDTIKRLKDLGIHGVIYDKMDVLSTKGTKENVFSVAAGDAQTKILRQIELESNPAEHLPETSKGSNSNGFTQVINLVAEQ